MLNFEPAPSSGYVVLPLEEYNRLRERANRKWFRFFELTYDGRQIQCEYDKRAIYSEILQELKEQYGAELDLFDVKPLGEFHAFNVTMANLKKE